MIQSIIHFLYFRAAFSHISHISSTLHLVSHIQPSHFIVFSTILAENCPFLKFVKYCTMAGLLVCVTFQLDFCLIAIFALLPFLYSWILIKTFLFISTVPMGSLYFIRIVSTQIKKFQITDIGIFSPLNTILKDFCLFLHICGENKHNYIPIHESIYI